MNILIVSHSFPPLNRVSTYRVYSFAKTWSELGHNVVVLTTKKYTFDGLLTYNKELNDIIVYEVPYASFITKKFEDKKCKGIMVDEKKPSIKIEKLKIFYRYIKRNVIGSSLALHSLWIKPATKVGRGILKDHNIDIVVSSFGPEASHIIASNLKKNNSKLFWVADYRDLWSVNHPLKHIGLFSLYQKFKERKILRDSDISLTVSVPLKRYLNDFLKKPSFVIENGFEEEEISQLEKNSIFPIDKIIRLVYTGTITPGTRDPSPLFRVLIKLENEGKITSDKLKILFYGNAENVLILAEEHKVVKFIELKGFVSKDDSLRAQRDAHALLFLEYENKLSNDPVTKGVLTGKLFEYIVSNTEIIGVGITNYSLSGQLIEDSKMGFSYGNDLVKIENAILEIITHGKKRMEPNYSIINKYRRDILAEKALNYISMLNSV